MKTFTAQIVFIAVLLALPVFVSAQVFEGDLTLSTQAEVDAFHYTEVTGSLTIGNPEEGAPSTDITNLNPLSTLTKVEASLIIVNNDQLQDLQGLGNLTFLRELYIIDNDQLENLQGLGNVIFLRELYIIDNDQLQDLQGLETLTILRDLYIIDNDQLQTLQGLENLQSLIQIYITNNPNLNDCCAIAELLNIVGGEVSIGGNGSNCNSVFTIQENCGIILILRTQAEVDAFNYTEVIGSLIIGNPEEGAPSTDITNLDPLSTLTKVEASLIIVNNNQLENLQGLNNLTTIGESLDIADNPALTSLQGLENLSSVVSISINNNDQLQNLQGLENISSLGGLSISGNDQLQNLQGLENLTTIEGNLDIADNPALTSLQGLKNLSSVVSISINNNDQLQDMQGLENISSLYSTEGRLSIGDNDQLQNLQGLNNLTSVTVFDISNNAQLQNLQGLDSFASAVEFYISNNTQLQNLQGLNNFTSIAYKPSYCGEGPCGILAITDNPALTSLQGLENLTDVGVEAYVVNNPMLNDCCAIADLLSVNGSVVIEGNGSNCNSVEDIQGNCIIGYVTLRTQAEVDAFNYTEVTGSLTIGKPDDGSSTDITSLKPLSILTKVGISLTIRNSNQLQDLQGLDNLVSVGEDLNLVNNASLTSLQGLNNLISIGEDLILENNASLTSLQGLENLTTIGGNISVAFNASLTSLQGLENLSSVNYLTIRENDQLQNLKGLENLTTIEELVLIRENARLQNLQGLENLSSLGNLYISDNAQLQNLQGLDNLTTVKFSIQLENNTSLTSLQSLENLQSVRYLFIHDNPMLNDCCAIADLLSKVTGAVGIEGNDSNCNSVEAIHESCPPVITGFTLVDAATNQDISDLELTNIPAVINLLETGNQLNIRANTAPETVGSVVFALDGVIINKENVAPYALAGDLPPGDYRSWTPTLGRHTLTATPYDGKNGKGQAGDPLTLEFVVIDQPLAVISFTLVTTDDDQDQYELKDGSTISLQQFDPAKLNIRANTYPEEVGSVVFDLNAVKNFQTENVFPYALAGDLPPGDYKDYTLKPGTYYLTATPYSMSRRRGEAGIPLSITFEVQEDMAVAKVARKSNEEDKEKEVFTYAADVEQGDSDLLVYPNPSTGIVKIEYRGIANESVRIAVYDLTGRKIYSTENKAPFTDQIDLQKFSKGLKIVKVQSANAVVTERIIIE